MRYLMLDIETVPLNIEHEDIINYLMDKKISKEARSLDPNYSKIIVICGKVLGEDVKVFADADEKKVLEEFWNFLNLNKDVTIVTHNGYGFDVPFLIVRSCINKVNIPIKINVNKWAMERSNHFDTMVFFSHYGNFINPSLEILGKMHNIEIEGERISGADIEKLYREGNLEKIKLKCKRDVEILEKVFSKLCLGYLEKKYF